MTFLARKIILLVIASVSFKSFGFDLIGVDVRGQAEASWQYAPIRNTTVFNPDELIINNPVQTGFLGLRLSPQYSKGSVTLRGDYWEQGTLANTNGRGSFYTQTSALDWNITTSLVASGGVDLIKWGPGYIWNPSNPFQDRELNFIDRVISYKRNGDVYANLDWTGSNGFGATAYYVNNKSREKLYGSNTPYTSSFALKLRKQFTSSDVAITYALLGDMNFVSGSYSTTIGSSLEFHTELSLRNRRRTILPTLIANPTGGGYFTFQANDKVQWRPQFLVGVQYTTEGQSNFILEYFYNGEGYSSHEFKQLETAAMASTVQLQSLYASDASGFLSNANSLLGSIGRHYIFARAATDRFMGDFEASAYLRYSIQDYGITIGMLLHYPIFKSTKLLFGGQYYTKPSNSETGAIPYDFVLYSGITLTY